MFSESSEEELLADSPKLQRANAKRFGKVSCEMTCPCVFFCLWYSLSVISVLYELLFDPQGIYFYIYVTRVTLSIIAGKTKYRDAR